METTTKGLIFKHSFFGSEDFDLHMGKYLKKEYIDEITNEGLGDLDDNEIYRVERTGDACDVTKVSALEYRSYVEEYISKTNKSEWEDFDNEEFKSIARDLKEWADRLERQEREANFGPEDSLDHQLETAKKTGYVQGVCECVAAILDNQNFGKKLLSEMNVTKDMAKKFANPETYKILEQGIFAPRHEQKQEQTHNIRR